MGLKTLLVPVTEGVASNCWFGEVRIEMQAAVPPSSAHKRLSSLFVHRGALAIRSEGPSHICALSPGEGLYRSLPVSTAALPQPVLHCRPGARLAPGSLP